MKQQKALLRLFSASVLMVGLVMQAVGPSLASAAQITTRSLTLQAGITDAGAKAGGVVNHLLAFTVPSVGATNVGSIKFQYCMLASGVCTLPAGLVTTAATMGSQAGATGFTLDATTNGAPFITRVSASVAAGAALSYQLQAVTNPTTVNQTFFVRISTYASIDASGAPTDTGTVTASTVEQIVLDGTMPESLVFCTGATIGTTVGVPDCLKATSGVIHFNQLFSPTDTATSTSQMAASTNAGVGYVISVNGPTLTSGSNTIAPIAVMGPGVRGISQFGINLKANTVTTATPAVGTEVAPTTNPTNFKGQAAPGYDTVDSFKFITNDTVANSQNAGVDAQIFTASYMVNVPGSQPAGTYVTTLTYICTPTY